MTIPQDYQTVLQTLQNAGYQEPPEVWTWNPFIYWDPIFHSGAEEFRLSVDNSSFHFGAKYPASPVCDPLFGCISPPDLAGRKTKLEEFHTDPHDPRYDPEGHLVYDLLHFPERPYWDVPVF